MSKVTQEQVDEAYNAIKKKWQTMRDEFTGSDVLFTMSRDALDFLGQYEIMREQILEEGFELPPIDDKIKVTICDAD